MNNTIKKIGIILEALVALACVFAIVVSFLPNEYFVSDNLTGNVASVSEVK